LVTGYMAFMNEICRQIRVASIVNQRMRVKE